MAQTRRRFLTILVLLGRVLDARHAAWNDADDKVNVGSEKGGPKLPHVFIENVTIPQSPLTHAQ